MATDSKALNIVIGNMQTMATETNDNVPKDLSLEVQKEQNRRRDNATRMSETDVNAEYNDMGRNLAMVATMNESANSNNYIARVAESQKEGVLRSLKHVDREHTLMSRALLHNVYVKDHYDYGTKVVKATLAFAAVLVLLGTLWSMERIDAIIVAMVSLVVAFIYIAYVIMIMTYLGKRRKEAGKRLSFKTTSQMESEIGRLVDAQRNC